MAIWSNDNKITTHDLSNQRVGAGTVGGDAIIPGSIPGRKVSAVVDSSNPGIVYGAISSYGTGTSSFDFYATNEFVTSGTQVIIGGQSGDGVVGSGCAYRFRGPSVAVLAGVNQYSGIIRVYIDGVETPGRINVFTSFRINGGSPSASANIDPIISATDTDIPALSQATNFPETGTIYINGELIEYTSRDTNGFYGCTRGVQGTLAVAHTSSETIYSWASAVDLYDANNYATKQVVYYNPLLSPGDHRIVIAAETSTNGGTGSRIYFDGFITGSIIGSGSILSQIATFYVNGTTSANGHMDIGSIVSQNNDVNKLAYLGWTQTLPSTESDNANTMAKVGMRYTSTGTPYMYLHNGPAGTTVQGLLTFAFLGETI